MFLGFSFLLPSTRMKRSVVLGTALTALVTAATVVWMEVRQEREFRRLIAAGDSALAGDRPSEAIEAFSGALAFKPRSMLAHLKRADTYRRRGGHELAAALRDARQANALDPTAPQPLELLGDVTAAMGRYEEAVDHYDRCLQLDDHAPRVLYKLALADVRRGRPRDAFEPLRKALAFDDRFAEGHYLMGVALRGSDRGEEAVRALTRAIEVNGALIPAREELADLQMARGRSRDAIDQLEAIAALEPTHPEPLVRVALLYARTGRRDAAVVTLGRASERQPDSPAVLTALARVWLETPGEPTDSIAVAKAIEALETVAKRPDVSSDALALLGQAFLLSGNVIDAERTLLQAVARQPVAPAAYRHLAQAARLRGHTIVARDAEARYRALAPEL